MKPLFTMTGPIACSQSAEGGSASSKLLDAKPQVTQWYCPYVGSVMLVITVDW